jgi:hypothetical protein
LAVSLETSLAEAERAGLTLPGRKLLDSPLCFPARQGLGVARTGVEDHFPEPPGLGSVAIFSGQDGEVTQGQVAVDALVDATELVGSFSPLASIPSRSPLPTSSTFTGHRPLPARRDYSPATRHYSERILQSRWSLRSRSAGSV